MLNNNQVEILSEVAFIFFHEHTYNFEKRMSLENITAMKYQEFFFFRKNFSPLFALSPKHEMNELQE